MVKPKVSIIVPVYNVEKYLSRCIKSILNQTFDNYELILINDGSKDNSLAICNDIAKKDDRILVIDQENQGSSVARNRGLEIAKGDYIIHIDSDDWLELNMIERLYETAVSTNADIVGCNIMFDDGEGNTRISTYSYSLELEEHLHIIKNVTIAVWNKLIRRKLYFDNDIKFIPGITMCDDLVVTTRLRYLSTKTVIIPDVLYHYFNAPRESICKTFEGKYPTSKLQVVEYLENYLLKKFPNRESIKLTIDNLRLYVIWDILKTKEFGGSGKWKELLKGSSSSITKCQLTSSQKIIMCVALILPSKVFDYIFLLSTKLRKIVR